MSRVLITGAGGMVGAHMVPELLNSGWEVAAMGRQDAPTARLTSHQHRLQWFRADLCDREQVAGVVAAWRPSHVLHLASTPFNPPVSSDTHVDVNVAGIDNLLDALKATPDVRVVYTGSAAQYGEGDRLKEATPEKPTTLLGASKAAAGILLHTYGRLFGMQTIELRLFTPYGPMERPQRLLPHTILSALRKQPVRLGNGRQERDYLYIDDVVAAVHAALVAPVASGSVFNVCSGIPTSVRALVTETLHLMGNPVTAEFDALPTRSDEIWKLSGDSTQAQKALNWSPRVSMVEGLNRSIEWYKQNRTLAEGLT